MASLQKKTVKGIDYWSIVESKRVNGKPRPIVVEYIGNTKKLFKRLQSNSPNIGAVKSYSHGDSHCLLLMADKLGIEGILDQAFKKERNNSIKRSRSLILAAIHRVCKPGSKNGFEEWFKTTTLPHELGIKPDIMTSQHFWRQMDSITEQELINAEDIITKKILGIYNIGLDKLALDYTNYFTYIDTNNQRSNLAKRGRNKQKRHDLKQCSLAIVTSKEAGIPLFSHVYEGNRNDGSEFAKYVPLLEKRVSGYASEEITLIFDGGNNTKDNLNTLKMHYICSFSLSYCKELYDIGIESYDEIAVNGRAVKQYRLTKNIWGKERTCILTFSESLYVGQVNDLDQDVIKTISELDELNNKINNTKSRIDKSEEGLKTRVLKILKAKKYIQDIINVKISDNIVEYEVNNDSKNAIINKYFGKKLTITDRADWPTEDILAAYYEQDCIEKIFRATKDNEHFSIRPQYHLNSRENYTYKQSFVPKTVISCLLSQ
jgi:transposase